MEYQPTFPERLVAAGGASVVAAVVTNPLEVLKTRLQTQVGLSNSSCPHARWQHARSHAVGSPNTLRQASGQPPLLLRWKKPPTATMASILRNLIRQEGALALWKGIRPALLAAVPTVGIYMPLYDIFRDRLEPSMGASTAPLLASTTARSIAVFTVAPLEVLRTQRMSQRTTAGVPRIVPPAGGCCIEVVQTDVVRVPATSLWLRGLPATLLRDIPFTAIFWTLTEAIRGPLLRTAATGGRQVRPRQGSNTPAEAAASADTWVLVQANAVAAGASGAVAAAVTTPFDVIKTQQQVSVSVGDRGRNLLEIGRGIVQRHGYRGLWVGVLLRSARAVPSGAMVVTTYEILKQRLAARPR
eukprot:jgi/Ulvmu1/9711/UM055_0049.1